MNIFIGARPVRTFEKVAPMLSVAESIKRWVQAHAEAPATQPKNTGVLIGDIAQSFYTRSVGSKHVELLFNVVPEKVPPIFWRRKRCQGLIDTLTGVQFDMHTEETLRIPRKVMIRVLNTARLIEGVQVASLEGLIAIRLFCADEKMRIANDACIMDMIGANPDFKPRRFLDTWVEATDEQIARIQRLALMARNK
jgi:hypothetical protein